MTVEAIRARTPDSIATSESSPAASTSSSPTPLPSAGTRNALTAAGDARRDQDVRRFVDARRDPSAPRLGNGVLYVGMNGMQSQCDREASLLARTGPGVRRSIGHAERDAELGSDHARLLSLSLSTGRGSAIVDLATNEGARAFAETLGLSAETTHTVAAIIREASPGSRDELAALAAVFARGELGDDVPSRLVLSGHCTGDSVYDGSGVLGTLRFTDVFALAHAMPRAAAQIEDVMLSACNSGHESPPAGVSIGAWAESFPNLKTVWAYAGAGPERSRSPTGSGALEHIEAWERATRGRQEHVNARRAIHAVADGRSAGFEGNVTVWSAADAAAAAAAAAKDEHMQNAPKGP